MVIPSLFSERSVYLVDLSVYKPPDELKINVEEVKKAGKAWKEYSEELEKFMMKIFVKSGISSTETYLPASIHPVHTKEADNSLNAGYREARMVMLGAVGDLLKKTGIRADQIDILVTCCSIYCPTPSMSSMIVNHFGMRQDIQSYSLGGMGCGTGVLGINLMRDLLKARPNSIAIFVPAEITSYCFYPGEEANRMISNVIFRMGGAAIMLSNRADMAARARYKLEHATRVLTASDDGAYACMSWGPDKDGINGVYLGRDVVKHAGHALMRCLRKITPRLLTWGQVAEAAYVITKHYLSAWWPTSKGDQAAEQRELEGPKGLEAYKPDFTKCVDHFAIHAGGYAVLKAVQNGMELPAATMLPSFAAMRDFGNTSCSTTWYIMAYLESMGMVHKGERVLQIGMGGGMKVGINVWRALRDVKYPHPAWRHLNGRPLSEDELPRGIEAVSLTGQSPAAQTPAGQPKSQAVQQAPAKVAAPAPAGVCNGGVCASGLKVHSELDDHGHPIEPEAL